MAQSSKFHQNCACFWLLHPHKTRTFSVRLYDHSTNTKRLLKTHLFNNCFNVAWLTHSQRFCSSAYGALLICLWLWLWLWNGFVVEVLVPMMPKFRLRTRLWPPDHSNCCKTDRQHSKIWTPQFQLNRLIYLASRRPIFVKIARLFWGMATWRFLQWLPSAILNFKILAYVTGPLL